MRVTDILIAEIYPAYFKPICGSFGRQAQTKKINAGTEISLPTFTHTSHIYSQCMYVR